MKPKKPKKRKRTCSKTKSLTSSSDQPSTSAGVTTSSAEAATTSAPETATISAASADDHLIDEFLHLSVPTANTGKNWSTPNYLGLNMLIRWSVIAGAKSKKKKKFNMRIQFSPKSDLRCDRDERFLSFSSFLLRIHSQRHATGSIVFAVTWNVVAMLFLTLPRSTLQRKCFYKTSK